MTSSQAAPDGALTISIPAAADRLGVGLSTTKLLIGRGELQTVRIGRRRLVVAQSLREYIVRLAT
jgi:excisionase family DNA binding protein